VGVATCEIVYEGGSLTYRHDVKSEGHEASVEKTIGRSDGGKCCWVEVGELWIGPREARR